MKLVCLNVALFEANNSKLKKFLHDQNPDLICLQEVTRGLEKAAHRKYLSLPTTDSASPDLKYLFFGPTCILGHFDQKGFFGSDNFKFNLESMLELGNYVKSRYKIVKAQNIFVENHFTFTTDSSTWPEEDYRAVQVVDIDIHSKKLRLLNYHGIWTKDKLGDAKTLTACRTILSYAANAPGEVIICGDFNLFPHTQSMQIFKRKFISLVDKYNISTTRPAIKKLSGAARNVVDYIWVSRGIKVKKFSVPSADVSDHLPLILEFSL